MAESQKTETEQVEGGTEKVKPEPAPVLFLLSSVIRGRNNRTTRALQPGRMPFVQRFAGGTILVRRARPARITEAALIANIEEIKRAAAQSKIVVTTLSGRVIDLGTLEAAPAPAEKPMPNPPLDSAKNDKNEGIGYDVPPTPEGTTMSAPEPELLKPTPGQVAAPEAPATEPVSSPIEDPVDAFLNANALPPEIEAEPKPELMDSRKSKQQKGKRG